MASSYPMKKNTATRIVFPILDNDGDLVSGAAGLDSEYSLDGGSFSDCTNEATEIGSSGVYYLDLQSGETNGDVVAIMVKTTTTDAKTTVLVFYTSAQTLDEVDAVADAIKAKTDNLPTDPADQSLLMAEHGTTQSAIAALNDLSAAEVNAEVDTALADLDLDHLIKVSYGASKPTIGSLIDKILNKNGSQTFDPITDSLEAIRDNQAGADAAAIADAVWDEAIADHTGGSTFGGKNQKVVPSETIGDYLADVSALALEATLSTHDADIKAVIAALNDLSDVEVWAYGTRTLTDPNSYKADVSALALEATLTAIKGAGWSDETLVAIKAAIDALDLSNLDVAVSTRATPAQVNTEVDNALNTVIPGTPTSGSINDFVERSMKILRNRWRILSNQLIFYDDDEVTPLYTFDLKDSAGDPASENVYDRVPA